MEPPEKSDQARQALRDAQINCALGVFLLFFAVIIGVSVFFTDTTIGKLTNLAAAAIIGLIGSAMVYRARTRKPTDLL